MDGRRSKFVSFALISIFAFSGHVAAAKPASDSSDDLRCETNPAIREAVARLQNAATFHAALSSLTAAPATAACYLIKDLSVVAETVLYPDDQRTHSEAMKVIWSLRALCSITAGLRFTASTEYRFDVERERQRREFLGAPDSNELRFFGVWMSRDVIYIAPSDVQTTIIKKWIEWYAANGRTFNYISSEGWEACYF
jgi:hypothetical protein